MWICRTWKRSLTDGWTSEMDQFETEKEAREFGEFFLMLQDFESLDKDYEVVKGDQ